MDSDVVFLYQWSLFYSYHVNNNFYDNSTTGTAHIRRRSGACQVVYISGCVSIAVALVAGY